MRTCSRARRHAETFRFNENQVPNFQTRPKPVNNPCQIRKHPCEICNFKTMQRLPLDHRRLRREAREEFLQRRAARPEGAAPPTPAPASLFSTPSSTATLAGTGRSRTVSFSFALKKNDPKLPNSLNSQTRHLREFNLFLSDVVRVEVLIRLSLWQQSPKA